MRRILTAMLGGAALLLAVAACDDGKDMGGPVGIVDRSDAGADRMQPPAVDVTEHDQPQPPPPPADVTQLPDPQPGDPDYDPDIAPDWPKRGPRFSKWLEPDERVDYDFGYEITDQAARTYKMAELHGKPTALSFIFTRCPNPQMCPATAVHTAATEKRLTEAGLADKVNLILITYDPAYDTPPHLTAFGERYGIKFNIARLAATRVEDWDAFHYEFQLSSVFEAEAKIKHAVELYLFDKRGRIVRFFVAGQWDINRVVADLAKLAEEPYELDEQK